MKIDNALLSESQKEEKIKRIGTQEVHRREEWKIKLHIIDLA